MAYPTPTSVLLFVSFFSFSSSITTCPGFPGFCSESFPGQSCNVVCDFGRNNVPLCQEDGTWTDIPRCIEHDPGVEEQIPGTCPSIPGYCAQGFLNTRCIFDCTTGKDIDSICTSDGTWSPYPTCLGDLRETRDGCDGCPGPNGGRRNRTAEAILNQNTISDRRVPKIIKNDGGRKKVPSFAGNINIGRINNPSSGSSFQDRFKNERPTPRQQTPPRGGSFQNSFNNQQRPATTQRSFVSQPRQVSSSTDAPPQSLFDQIKNRINKAKTTTTSPSRAEATTLSPLQQRLRDQILRQKQQQSQSIDDILSSDSKPPLPSTRPSPIRVTQPQQPRTFPTQTFSGSSFGVFEAVDLSSKFGGPNPSPTPTQAIPVVNDGFFGVFQEVNLQ